MSEVTLFTEILGLEKPWIISNIYLNPTNEEIIIYLKYESKTGICPTCKKEYSLYDNCNNRSWRHLDTCQLKTFLNGNVPRVNCKEHGVQSISTPWAEPHRRLTTLFEQFAIKLLQATQNQTKAADILRISFHQIHLIMEKAVELGLVRRGKMDIEHLGIDEKSMNKGHTYITVASDIKTGTILDVIEDRTSEATKKLLTALKETHNLLPLKAVSMDMWKAFMNETAIVLPEADIVHDKFHIIKYLNEAVDKTRIEENKKLVENNDETLKKSKYLFLKNEENMTEKQLNSFEILKELTLKTCQAWRIKENFKGFFKCTYINEAKTYFNQWFHDVKESGITQMLKVGTMLLHHGEGLLNYIKHKISNGMAENLNGQIQRIKTVGRGFNSFKNFRNAILFYLGKLDMTPHKT